MSLKYNENMPMLSCRFFNGYKPCGKSLTCSQECSEFQPLKNNILIIHLGALGAVLRSTSLLKGIHEKYPQSKVVWITQSPAHKLLENNPYIDQVLTADFQGLSRAKSMSYDVAFVIDKSQEAIGIAKSLEIGQHFGFITDKWGHIGAANQASKELWNLGLDNHKKFFVNKKSEVQLMYESFQLPYRTLSNPDNFEYVINLNTEEKSLVNERKKLWQGSSYFKIIGINTGCSSVIPYKKLTVKKTRELCLKLSAIKNVRVVLLGGPEDQERNEEISNGLPVVNSPCNLGLRDGLCSVAACDVVFSGDSLGMHMAIALKKYVVAWFGPTCAHEIELYGRGVHVLTSASCSPCWKRSCEKERMCYDEVSVHSIVSAVHKGLSCAPSLSYKQPFLEISS